MTLDHGRGVDANKKRLFAAGAFVLLVTLLFVIGEAVIRLAATHYRSVRYLATAGEESAATLFPDLKSYLASLPQVAPFRNNFNHYTNSLGFFDTEFTQEKEPGVYRIMAVGDSFSFGSAPYPEAVMTLVENELAKSCRGKKIELQNFGVTGTGVWDYYQVVELGAPLYRPDLIVVHLYLGNDGPSHFFQVHDIPDLAFAPGPSSYLVTYIANAITLATSLEDAAKEEEVKEGAGSVKKERRATEPVRRRTQITDSSPIMQNPYFTEEKWYSEIAANELSRYFVADEATTGRLWAPVIASLEALLASAKGQGIPVVMVFFPSQFQVHPEEVAAFFERQPGHPRLEGFIREKVDLDLPAQKFKAVCDKWGIDCFDTTPLVRDYAAKEKVRLYRYRETHWNIAGNRAGAEAEGGFLTQKVCP